MNDNISSLIVEGTGISDEEVIKNHRKDFYYCLFIEVEAHMSFLGGLELKMIDLAQAAMSEGDFIEGENW